MGVAAMPFDPPLSFPIDLASAPTGGGELVVRTAGRLRDAEGSLTHRSLRTRLPGD